MRFLAGMLLGIVLGIILQWYWPGAAAGLDTLHNRYMAWSEAKADANYQLRHVTPTP